MSSSQTPKHIGLKYGRGEIFAHHEEIRHLIKAPVNQASITLGFQTTGKKKWQRIWNYPEIGVGFYTADLRNPQVLGVPMAFYGFFEAPIFRQKRFSFNYLFALGAVYLNKHFDRLTNNTNIVNGSVINIYANVDLELRYATKYGIYFTTLGLTHYSNGGSQIPNLGLNVFAVSVGARFKTADFEIPKKTKKEKHEKSWDIHFLQSFSLHSDKHSYSKPKRFITTTSVDCGWYLSNKSRIGGGADFLFDDIGRTVYKFDTSYVVKDYKSVGLHLSYSIVYGNVLFSLQEIYFFNRRETRQRAGFRLLVKGNVTLGLSLLMHDFAADAVEPSIGIRFGNRK